MEHCRIKSKQDMGQVKYYLIETTLFDSLYDLITYYQQVPLRSPSFVMKLTKPVPQLKSHEDKEWYHDNLSRAAAEDMLKRIPNDGAFLIRRGQAGDSYAISFRYLIFHGQSSANNHHDLLFFRPKINKMPEVPCFILLINLQMRVLFQKAFRIFPFF